jgi:hypothetical protein
VRALTNLVGLAQPAGELAVELVKPLDAVMQHVQAPGVGRRPGDTQVLNGPRQVKVPAKRAAPSGLLLIRGFGVQIPGGAPVLTWRSLLLAPLGGPLPWNESIRCFAAHIAHTAHPGSSPDHAE